jgi:hypothetical protein
VGAPDVGSAADNDGPDDDDHHDRDDHDDHPDIDDRNAIGELDAEQFDVDHAESGRAGAPARAGIDDCTAGKLALPVQPGGPATLACRDDHP